MSKEEMEFYEKLESGKFAGKRNLWWKKEEKKFEYIVEVKK